MFINWLNKYFVFGLQFYATTGTLHVWRWTKIRQRRLEVLSRTSDGLFVTSERASLSVSNQHNFWKEEQEEVNQGIILIYGKLLPGQLVVIVGEHWQSEFANVLNMGLFCKTPKGSWRNNKSLLWMENSTHNIEERNSFDPASFLLHILSFAAECDRDSGRSSTSDHSIKRRQ